MNKSSRQVTCAGDAPGAYRKNKTRNEKKKSCFSEQPPMDAREQVLFRLSGTHTPQASVAALHLSPASSVSIFFRSVNSNRSIN